jgi:hypothetical protein
MRMVSFLLIFIFMGLALPEHRQQIIFYYLQDAPAFPSTAILKDAVMER